LTLDRGSPSHGSRGVLFLIGLPGDRHRSSLVVTERQRLVHVLGVHPLGAGVRTFSASVRARHSLPSQRGPRRLICQSGGAAWGVAQTSQC
jgi:hypothetical protein